MTVPVLHLTLAEVVQERLPMAVLREIVRHPFGEENVPGVAAIHHPLRHVDAPAGDIGPLVHVGHFVNRSTVNAHSQLQLRMSFVGAA